MAYLVVSKCKKEFIFRRKPYRLKTSWSDQTYTSKERIVHTIDGAYTEIDSVISKHDSGIQLPKGTIEKLIGKIITWKDNPVYFRH